MQGVPARHGPDRFGKADSVSFGFVGSCRRFMAVFQERVAAGTSRYRSKSRNIADHWNSLGLSAFGAVLYHGQSLVFFAGDSVVHGGAFLGR